MASSPQSSTKPTLQNKNVASGQLAFFARDTGFYKDGYCRTGPDDQDNTSIAASLTEDFINPRGSSLKSQGAQPGSEWCLSTKLWKDAFDAAQQGGLATSSVPQVHLHATHETALQDVSYRQSKQFEAPREVGGRRGRQDDHDDPQSGSCVSKQANSLGGDMRTTAPAPRDIHNKKTEGA